MEFKVMAKRFGDFVEFHVDANDVKEALVAARAEAHRVFDTKPGDPGSPTVSVKPVVEKD